jgi:hypothetical protein
MRMFTIRYRARPSTAQQIFQQDAVLQGLVPALGLALGRCATMNLPASAVTRA